MILLSVKLPGHVMGGKIAGYELLVPKQEGASEYRYPTCCISDITLSGAASPLLRNSSKMRVHT